MIEFLNASVSTRNTAVLWMGLSGLKSHWYCIIKKQLQHLVSSDLRCIRAPHNTRAHDKIRSLYLDWRSSSLIIWTNIHWKLSQAYEIVSMVDCNTICLARVCSNLFCSIIMQRFLSFCSHSSAICCPVQLDSNRCENCIDYQCKQQLIPVEKPLDMEEGYLFQISLSTNLFCVAQCRRHQIQIAYFLHFAHSLTDEITVFSCYSANYSKQFNIVFALGELDIGTPINALYIWLFIRQTQILTFAHTSQT